MSANVFVPARDEFARWSELISRKKQISWAPAAQALIQPSPRGRGQLGSPQPEPKSGNGAIAIDPHLRSHTARLTTRVWAFRFLREGRATVRSAVANMATPSRIWRTL